MDLPGSSENNKPPADERKEKTALTRFNDLDIGSKMPFLHNRVYQAASFDNTQVDVNGARVIGGQADDFSFTHWNDATFTGVSAGSRTNAKNTNVDFFNGTYKDYVAKNASDVQAFDSLFGDFAFRNVERFTGVHMQAQHHAFDNASYVTLINSLLGNFALQDVRFADVRVTDETARKELLKKQDTILGNDGLYFAKDSQLNNVSTGKRLGHHAQNLAIIGGDIGDEAFYDAEDIFVFSKEGSLGKIYRPRSGIVFANNIDEVLDPGYETSSIVFSTKTRPGTTSIDSTQFESVGRAVRTAYNEMSKTTPSDNPKISDTTPRVGALKQAVLEKTYAMARDKLDDNTLAYVEKQLS